MAEGHGFSPDPETRENMKGMRRQQTAQRFDRTEMDEDVSDQSKGAVQKRAVRALKMYWGDEANQLGIWKRRLGGVSVRAMPSIHGSGSKAAGARRAMRATRPGGDSV